MRIETSPSEPTPAPQLLPLVLPGFTDSHWFRKAFPECVAYGFFPQRAMSFFETAPLIHAPDERIAIDDLELASRFYRELSLDATWHRVRGRMACVGIRRMK